MRHELPKRFERAYEKARLLAEAETGLEVEVFPDTCPMRLEQVLDADFWPD